MVINGRNINSSYIPAPATTVEESLEKNKDKRQKLKDKSMRT
jgi:hypothetical protein